MDEFSILKGSYDSLPSSRNASSIYITTGDSENDGIIYIGNYQWNSRVDSGLSETSTNAVANSAITSSLLDDEKVISSSFKKIQSAIGADDNLNISFADEGTNYLETSDNVLDALEVLDAEIAKKADISIVPTDYLTSNDKTEIEAKIPTEYLSGVTFNGNAVEVTDKVAALELAIDNELDSGSTNLVVNSAITSVILNDEYVYTKAFQAVKNSVGLDEYLSYSFSGTGTNYLDTAENVIDAVNILDEELSNKANASDIPTDYLTSADRTSIESKIPTNYVSGVTVNGTAVTVTNHVAAITTTDYGTQIQKIKESVGLDDDLDYSASQTSKYISGATSVENALELLNDVIASKDLVVSNALSAIQAGVGLEDDMSYSASSSSVLIKDATSLANAVEILDENITSAQSSLANKADAATTISGYGITDAYTKDEIDTKFSEIETLLASI